MCFYRRIKYEIGVEINHCVLCDDFLLECARQRTHGSKLRSSLTQGHLEELAAGAGL